MDNRKLLIDNSSLGTSQMLLVAVRPAYDYVDGKRSEQTGFFYDTCLVKHGLSRVSVRITGKQLIEAPEQGFISVEFTDLLVRPYVGRDGRLALTATASAIKAVNTKG